MTIETTNDTTIRRYAVHTRSEYFLLITWGEGVKPTTKMIAEWKIPADAIVLWPDDLQRIIKWASERGYPVGDDDMWDPQTGEFWSREVVMNIK